MIIKSNGLREPFSKEKIMQTAGRAGAKPEVALEIAEQVARRVKPGMQTGQIFKMTLKLLAEHSRPIAMRYNLQQALFKLGPTGFEFEKYIAELLKVYKYKARLPKNLTGACVTHEVDVIAIKDRRTAMIECKFRNSQNIYVGIKDAMATWSRFLDLVEGAELGNCEHMDECWIVTNTRFSPDALKWAHCKGMVMISWNHPEERSLAHMIDAHAVYPITVLPDIRTQDFAGLARGQVMLLKQLIVENPKELARKTGLPIEKIRHFAEEAGQIINLKN